MTERKFNLDNNAVDLPGQTRGIRKSLMRITRPEEIYEGLTPIERVSTPSYAMPSVVVLNENPFSTVIVFTYPNGMVRW